jgi:hypothetical protein
MIRRSWTVSASFDGADLVMSMCYEGMIVGDEFQEWQMCKDDRTEGQSICLSWPRTWFISCLELEDKREGLYR